MPTSVVRCAQGAFTASILLCTVAGALPQKTAVKPGGTAPGVTAAIDLTPKNKLRFPYGVQSFERKENLKIGGDITTIPGWTMQGTNGVVTAQIAEHPNALTRPGTNSRRWLDIQDFGAGAGDGFITPTIQAPAPWNYAWNFALQVVTAPAPGSDTPTLAIQHFEAGSFQDAWGVRLTSSGAELFLTSAWGEPVTAPLFAYAGATDVGQWVTVRVVASLSDNTMTGFVNGTKVAFLRNRVPETTDVRKLRFSYHGSGAGNIASILLDDMGVAFLSPTCDQTFTFDFDTEDDLTTPLGNGQDLTTPPEFGVRFNLSAAGSNLGATTFDSTPGGPNAGTEDDDMLIGRGNILMLQRDTEPTQTVPGFFDVPVDDIDGGDFVFDFTRPCEVLGVTLIDIDPEPNLGASVILTDFSSLTRTYTVQPGWTGTFGGTPGWKTLDTTILSDQIGNAPGFRRATAVEDPGFDPNAAVKMVVHLTGRGAMDDLSIHLQCVDLTFDTQDDSTPVFAGTPLADGQDISTPPEFGNEVSILSSGPNSGAAMFDSTPGGPNDPGPDNDLLVGLGNILILQNNLAATQTVPGFFDTPNDDTNGGDIFFNFPAGVLCHQMDLIDVDEEEITGVTVTLLDSGGKTRTFSVPPGWTEDLLNDGPPGFRTLDLETLAPQPGFLFPATAVEDPGFDPTKVVQAHVNLGGAQDMDNFCFCP